MKSLAFEISTRSSIDFLPESLPRSAPRSPQVPISLEFQILKKERGEREKEEKKQILSSRKHRTNYRSNVIWRGQRTKLKRLSKESFLFLRFGSSSNYHNCLFTLVVVVVGEKERESDREALSMNVEKRGSSDLVSTFMR